MKFYTSVTESLPTVEDAKFPHMKRLILIHRTFGVFLGFYDGEHFRTSYAEILENVTHWALIPKVEE